jgi:hypothetical protein
MQLEDYDPIDWMAYGKCQSDDLPYDFFFPTIRHGEEDAKSLEQAEEVRAGYCLGVKDNNICKVREECLNYAIQNNERGVWGGTSENERKKIKKRRGRQRLIQAK